MYEINGQIQYHQHKIKGQCGSCWAFAIVQCLSSRFFTCGKEDCVKQKDLEIALNEIRDKYKIQKTSLRHIFYRLDINPANGKISQLEWVHIFKTYRRYIIDICHDSHCKKWDNSKLVKIMAENKTIGQITDVLGFMLTQPIEMLRPEILPSISIKLFFDTPEKQLIQRTIRVFQSWLIPGEINISLKNWTNYFYHKPLNLSVEQVLVCCNDCTPMTTKKSPSGLSANNACAGNTLEKGWHQLYTAGTVSSYCSNYNLYDYTDQDIPSCFETQGPGFSYCGGGLPLRNWDTKELNKFLINSEKTNTLPFTPELALGWNKQKIDLTPNELIY